MLDPPRTSTSLTSTKFGRIPTELEWNTTSKMEIARRVLEIDFVTLDFPKMLTCYPGRQFLGTKDGDTISRAGADVRHG